MTKLRLFNFNRNAMLFMLFSLFLLFTVFAVAIIDPRFPIRIEYWLVLRIPYLFLVSFLLLVFDKKKESQLLKDVFLPVAMALSFTPFLLELHAVSILIYVSIFFFYLVYLESTAQMKKRLSYYLFYYLGSMILVIFELALLLSLF